MNWNLVIRQIRTISKVEIARYVLARRWLGVYLAAFAPVGLLALDRLIQSRRTIPSISDFSQIYAVLFQTFVLRLSVFLSCALVFSQLFRGEMLEKTLHFYLLTPVRREVIAVGKYLAGVAAMALIFGTTTLLSNLLLYSNSPSMSSFFFEGPGMSYLGAYVLVVVLACAAYGGIFMLAGLLFRNPIVAAFLVGVWEAFYFILPETLQKLTVMHYLQSLLPLVIDRGPFSVIIDPTNPVLSVLVVIGIAVGFVFLSGKVLRRTQIAYSAD
jgi:ABC-type transport system involved in multi-copper enzyme maturation permease subunit